MNGKITQSDLFPFKPRVTPHVQKLIQYWHDSMDPCLRFVYCADGTRKFTTITDEEHFKKSILPLQEIFHEGFSSFKVSLELIINAMDSEKGISLNDQTIKHALQDMFNKSILPYYNEPLRKIQQYMDDHIHSEEDIKLIWTMMEDNGFFLTDDDEPDEEYRKEYVNNIGIILVLAICQRQIEHWELLQNELSRNNLDRPLGVLVDLVPIMISAGRTGKSTFLQNLGLGKYHTDECQILPKGKNRSPETAFFKPTMEKLVSELNELLITPDNIDEIKDYVSRRSANYADLYEERKDHPLTSVYVGTSNNSQVIYGMENIGRFAPIYHKRVDVPYEHDENGQCTDDYFLKVLAEGLYLVTKLGQTWKQYYTDRMKMIQKELSKSVSYRSSLFDTLLDYLEKCFHDLKVKTDGTLDSYEDLKLLKSDIRNGFVTKCSGEYEKKEIQAAWKQLESDMNPTTGRQLYKYRLKRIHDVEDNYNLTHDYIVKTD